MSMPGSFAWQRTCWHRCEKSNTDMYAGRTIIAKSGGDPAIAPARLRAVQFDHFTSGPFIGLPIGYFRIAHIDPPWTFHAWSHRGDGKGACQHYKCQTLDDIMALPVGNARRRD